MHKNIENQTTTFASWRLLKVQEVAEVLNVSRSFAYFLLQSGGIPVVKMGRAVRVRPQDLQNYIEQNINRQGENI